MRNRWLSGLACVLFLVWIVLPMAARAEQIRSFETEIELSTEDRFLVVERIGWDFGSQRKRGIFRDIPISYGRGRAADYRIRIEIDRVSLDGEPVPFREERRGSVLNLRIGDPDGRVTGFHTYEIRYAVERGLLFFEEHDEIYWNVTGFDWQVPMSAVSATVHLPERAPIGREAQIQVACFTGVMGSVEQSCTIAPTGDGMRFEADRPLRSGENLSIVLGLPKGLIREPSASERFWARARDYSSPWLLFPLATAMGMSWLWNRFGRDPRRKHAIDVRYEPPAGLSPAEVGTVLDEEVDMLDMTSTILDLAVKGFLRIEEIETEKFLFLKTKDYALIRLDQPIDSLRGHERLMLEKLFSAGKRVLVSQLKNDFYRHLPALRDSIYKELSDDQGYFPTAPDKVRTRWAGMGIGTLVLGPVAFVLTGQWAPGICVALAGAVVLGFSRFMPRRTRKGRRAYEEILGFQEFLERVDADRLERMGTRTVEGFERILAYAVVLGAADQWANAFGDLYTEPPSWYHSSRYDVRFHSGIFVSDLGNSLESIGSSIASTPRSSGSGSSGFGGGGSSGGGFGGGGGGSW